MRPRKSLALVGTLVLLLFAFVGLARAADPVNQILVNYADIFKANPMPAGDKAQAIKVADDETATLFLAKFASGGEVKAHFHKTHSETLYIIEGSGQMMVEGKLFEFRPGSVIHIPPTKVHSVKITGNKDLIALQVFAPQWKEPDRIFVP